MRANSPKQCCPALWFSSVFLNPESADSNESANYRYGKGKKMNLGPRGQSQRVIIPSDYDYAFASFIINVYELKVIYRVLQNISELIVSIYELKKVIYRVLQKRIWQSEKVKMVWRRHCQILEHMQKL